MQDDAHSDSDASLLEGGSTYPWLSSYPKGIDWHAELPITDVASLLDDAASRYADRVCVRFFGKTASYRDIADSARQFALGLASIGIRKGDRVGLVLPNCPIYPIAFFGILKLGATVVNFNPLYSPEEMIHQARDADVDVLITLDLKRISDRVAAVLAEKATRKVIVASFASLLPLDKKALFLLAKRREIASLASIGPKSDVLRYEDLIDVGKTRLSEGSVAVESPSLNLREDVAVLQYTGGTTGVPKGAMLTHANLTSNCRQIQLWFPELADGDEKILAILPMFHVFSLAVCLFGISNGFELMLLPKFDIGETMKSIRKDRPTIFPGVPSLFSALIAYKGARREDFGSLRYCVSGGAALPVETRKGFEELTGSLLVEGYGLSETSPVASINPFDGLRKESSIGQPVPGTILSIRSQEDTARAVALGEIGEICIKGPQVMKGYLNNREETERAFTGDYFRTGDLGHMDADGFTYVVDRIKDMINCSGFKVYPRRIEEAILSHPAVLEAAVIGVPDESRGEAPTAFATLKPGMSVLESELKSHIRGLLSRMEMPREIELRDEIPKTMIGKPSKKALRSARGVS